MSAFKLRRGVRPARPKACDGAHDPTPRSSWAAIEVAHASTCAQSRQSPSRPRAKRTGSFSQRPSLLLSSLPPDSMCSRACVDATSFSTSEGRIAFGSFATGGLPTIEPLPNSQVGRSVSSSACCRRSESPPSARARNRSRSRARRPRSGGHRRRPATLQPGPRSRGPRDRRRCDLRSLRSPRAWSLLQTRTLMTRFASFSATASSVRPVNVRPGVRARHAQREQREHEREGPYSHHNSSPRLHVNAATVSSTKTAASAQPRGRGSTPLCSRGSAHRPPGRTIVASTE